MSTAQREHEFKNLVSLYARTYAPRNWKIRSIKVDVLDVQTWMNRVRNAKTDIEFFEICSEYIATFQDGHAAYVMNSSFAADLGLWTDIYAGKVLIESVDRLRYPVSSFPIAVGDELVSIDGVAVEDLLQNLSKRISFGNPIARTRLAADALTYRSQRLHPDAVDLPDSAQIVIRNSEGELNAFTFTWEKNGQPFRNVSPTSWPKFNTGLKNISSPLEEIAGYENLPEIDSARTPRELQWASILPINKAVLERTIVDDQGNEIPRKAAIGWGSSFPYYYAGLPAGFRFRAFGENFISGIYTSGEYQIGYIRIGHFAPSDPQNSVYQFEKEIEYFRTATDGLVIDDSRNTGGYGCLSLDYAQRLIPHPFNFLRVQFRPTQSMINSMHASLDNAISRKADQWIIETYEFYLNDLIATIQRPDGMTGAMPFCVPFTGRDWAPTVENFPVRDADGNVAAYDKPLIVLVDELSASTGDMFPAIIQDAKRGLIVGTRTAGLGGSVSNTRVGMYSESIGYFTQSLLVRDMEAEAPGIPPSKFIENVGVIPDVELEYMKKENLMQQGRPFVEKFTSIIVEEITKSKGGQ